MTAAQTNCAPENLSIQQNKIQEVIMKTEKEGGY